MGSRAARDEARAIPREPVQEIGRPHDHIAGGIGSRHHDSVNDKLARAMVTVAPAESAFTRMVIGDVPLDARDADAN